MKCKKYTYQVEKSFLLERQTLYVGMAQVKYDVIGTQKAFKLGEDS